MEKLPRRYNAGRLRIRDASGKIIDNARRARLDDSFQSRRTGSEQKKKCSLLVERVIQ